ncbi:hypothetical protein JTB14_005396 [Gonioctena quinquepunctata]|nr:hypothetical protein JTB14_005396 [Gonioctena quinquepunctata]
MHTERAIKLLEFGLNTILNSKERKTSLQELYSIVENLHNTHRTLLYEKLQDILEEVLLQKLDSLLKSMENLLTSIKSLWTEFCDHITTIKNIFLKCDRSKHSTKYYNVHQLSTNLFKSIIILNSKIKCGLTSEILHLIQLHRKGNEVNKNLLESVLEMLTELQMYEEVFQYEFLKVSNIFYADEGDILINMIDIRTYLKHTRARIREEQERSTYCLNKYTSSAVLEIVYKNLIKDHMIDILDKAFDHLRKGKIEELGILFDLVLKVSSGLKTLSEYFLDYIIQRGTWIVMRPDNEKTMIQDLLEFKDKLDNIVDNSFKSNLLFSNIIRNSFNKFINSKQNKPAQLLAKYIDLRLRSKDISEEQLEVVLDKVMVIFRYISGKDIFEAFYKKDLAKRLLLGKSTSQDAEDSMIGKLKSECGTGFTSKIEGMFKDINISQGINQAFKQHLIHTATFSSDLCINVLTSSFWPNYPTYNTSIPQELAEYQVNFQKFYATNHSGRKLVWQPSLGHCIVKAVFDNGNKELQVSLFQTMVLLLFNTSEKLTFSEICELTNIETEELKRTLLSLACAKVGSYSNYPKLETLRMMTPFV